MTEALIEPTAVGEAVLGFLERVDRQRLDVEVHDGPSAVWRDDVDLGACATTRNVRA